MLEDRYWWVKEGFPSFEAGDDGYPAPGQVIQHYRMKKLVNGKPLRQRDVARMLDISERAMWALEKAQEGLDSFSRRKKLITLLDIPPALLKLDASYIADKQESHPPGQVIREYRKKKKRDNDKTWTQADLAELLGVTEKTVQAMENHDIGLDSVSRRELLVRILAVPPTLLGLDAAHLFEKTPTFTGVRSQPSQQPLFYQHRLKTYQSLLPTYWENHYRGNAKDAFYEIEEAIRNLREIAVYLNDQQQQHIKSLLCQYHQLALDFARDQGNFETALVHADLTIILAENMQQNELLASALYRRGLMYFDMGNLPAAAEDLKHALPYARSARPQLKGMVYMEAGRFQAHVAHNSADQLQACRLLDQTENIVRQGQREDDPYHVKLDVGRYHIGRAATLLALRRPGKALEELDDAERLTKPEHVRRHAYINILRARAYFLKGDFDFAAELVLDALQTCLKIRSGSNIADIARLHSQLVQTSFGDSPTVAQLGILLQTRRK